MYFTNIPTFQKSSSNFKISFLIQKVVLDLKNIPLFQKHVHEFTNLKMKNRKEKQTRKEKKNQEKTGKATKETTEKKEKNNQGRIEKRIKENQWGGFTRGIGFTRAEPNQPHKQ